MSPWADFFSFLTGPYYKYRVYSDMLKGTAIDGGVDCVKSVLQRIRVVPLYAVAFLLTAHYFPLSVCFKIVTIFKFRPAIFNFS